MTSQKCCVGCKVAGLLVVLGAINWGLYGVFGINLVANLLGDMTTGAKIVYGLIGVAGVLKLVSCFVKCPGCCKDSGDTCKK